MKKIYKRLIVFVVAFAATIGVNIWLAARHYYEPGKNGEYKVAINETFAIKLDENGSTGYSVCWLEMPEGIKLMGKEFEPSLAAAVKNEGAGGISTFTFTALKAGTYKLHAAHCPTGVEKKECTDFNLKNSKPDNIFTITVTP